MPTTARTPSHRPEGDRAPSWIIVASMFVGQRLDRGAAIGAGTAAAATLVVSLIIILIVASH
jgi:hypothetical protein